MDVSLDSNIYLSDLRMEGIAFRSLLDYLRKTQSRIILPKVVLDEVIAKYRIGFEMKLAKPKML